MLLVVVLFVLLPLGLGDAVAGLVLVGGWSTSAVWLRGLIRHFRLAFADETDAQVINTVKQKRAKCDNGRLRIISGLGRGL